MTSISTPLGLDKPLATIAGFTPHAACLAWNEMDPAALGELADDIAANGLLDPLTLTPDGELLDGRNRALACVMAGLEPKTITYDGDPWLFSISKNARRRHLTDDQIAMIAARLAKRGEGAPVGNQNASKTTGPVGPVVSASNLSVAQVAKAAGVKETKIKAAKVVLRDGTPEERKAVETGAAKLRPTAGKVRDRKRASAQKVEKTKKSDPVPDSDPIDDVAIDIIAKASDDRWRTLPKIASAVSVADSAAREALKRLGKDVETRKVDGALEYRIKSGEAADESEKLRGQLAVKDAVIADLKTQLAKKDAEIARLKAELAATAPRPTADRKTDVSRGPAQTASTGMN